MSNFAWDDLILKFGLSGQLYYSIGAYIDEQSALKLKAMLEDWHPKGTTWKQKKVVGTKEWDGNLELGGLFDDTATSGPHALFHGADGANIGLAGVVAETFDGTNWRGVNVIIQDYVQEPKQADNTRFKVTLVPYGSPFYTATPPTGTVALYS